MNPITSLKRITAGVTLATILAIPGAAVGGSAAAQTLPGDPYVVPIQGNAFVPATLQVAAGTTLTWANRDGVAHEVVANDLSFASPLLNPGESYSFTFSAPGIYNYVCDLHVNMSGTIEVVAA